MSVGDLHSGADLVRDVISAVVSGLLLYAVRGMLSHRRDTRKRLERHAVEIRHTQKSAGIEPFYEGDDF